MTVTAHTANPAYDSLTSMSRQHTRNPPLSHHSLTRNREIADKVLNLREAHQELEKSGQANVRLRVAKQMPAVRYLGTDLPDAAGTPPS